MKNILLIITLFISWNAFAEEKMWYCSSEKSGGLGYENGKWIVKSFYPMKRITIKQTQDRLIFPKGHSKLGVLSGSKCTTDFDGWIYCSSFAKTFVLNPRNGIATSASYLGRLQGGENADSMSVSSWKCESF